MCMNKCFSLYLSRNGDVPKRDFNIMCILQVTYSPFSLENKHDDDDDIT